MRECFRRPESLHAAMGYYRAFSFRPMPGLQVPITVPTVTFAGLHDRVLQPSDFHRARSMFEGDYVVEEVPGGHFLHREHPDVFAERLLAHLTP